MSNRRIMNTVNQESLKEKVALAAIDYLKRNLHDEQSVLGIGTGSTVDHFIRALGKIKPLFSAAVASSERSAMLLKEMGIPVYDLNSVHDIPFYIDGADEADASLNLIKGGGGALTREKIIAAVAKKFICIVDKSKCVPVLGKFPLPIEVIPMARSYVARQILKLGGNPVYRQGFTTDNGNIILDVHHLIIAEPLALEETINNIPGVVTVGLFARRKADLLMAAVKEGVKVTHAGSRHIEMYTP